jgi:hypothetical protein
MSDVKPQNLLPIARRGLSPNASRRQVRYWPDSVVATFPCDVCYLRQSCCGATGRRLGDATAIAYACTRSSSAGVSGVKKMNMFATTMVAARK